MTGRRRARRARTKRHAQLVEQLGISDPFSLSELQSGLERHTGRPAQLAPADLVSGSPSGFWFRKNGADFVFYERRTSPFHQAYIALHLVAHIVLSEADRTMHDPLLTPSLSRDQVGEILGEVDSRRVSDAEADNFAFLALHSAGSISWITARRTLRQLEPLRRALVGAVPQAARAPGETALPGATRRLCQAMIEIRDAALALRPYRDPEVAAAARDAGFAGRDLAAAVEAAVLGDAVRARQAGEPVQPVPEDGPFDPPGLRVDLASEAAWLTHLAKAFARQANRRPGRRPRGWVD